VHQKEDPPGAEDSPIQNSCVVALETRFRRRFARNNEEDGGPAPKYLRDQYEFKGTSEWNDESGKYTVPMAVSNDRRIETSVTLDCYLVSKVLRTQSILGSFQFSSSIVIIPS
jgi:hypothetical protein